MKTLLVSINAKFIHSNLAIRYLKAYTDKKLTADIELVEFTINQQSDLILREIYKKEPKVIGFSCYIWNYEIVKRLLCELKKLLPDCIFILGGPEVSYNSCQVLAETFADIVIFGEGEKSFCEIIDSIQKGNSYNKIKGIACKIDEKPIANEQALLIDMAEIPFVYDNYDFLALNNRIIYYEASRGCPFNCQYCLSGNNNIVRFLPLTRVFADLSVFLDAKVAQVKFVDRTFNCNKNYSLAIWEFLSENDNGITNFHFEIAAELLDDEMILALNALRKGLVQLEIGVQSINKETLMAIKRITLPQKLTPIVNSLHKSKNINLHLDLIAGLPYESYEKFKESFNYVYSLMPNQLQLGFLKLLKGSGLFNEQKNYGITCTNYAPYEVISTNWLSYNDILRLKMVEDMVETYYNSGRYELEIAYLISLFSAPFDMFEALGDYFERQNFHLAPHSKTGYYDILFSFFQNLCKGDVEYFKWTALYDNYAHEKAKRLPDFLSISKISNYKKQVYDFVDKEQNRKKYFAAYSEFDTKQIMRTVHFEVFPFNPLDGEVKETFLLFDYASDIIHQINLNC